MCSSATSILSSTFDLFNYESRDVAVLTDKKIREIVARELNDIKTRLDGLSRRNLFRETRLDCLSRINLFHSYTFLKEGVQLLIACLDESKGKQKSVMNEKEHVSGKVSKEPSCAKSDDKLKDDLSMQQTHKHDHGEVSRILSYKKSLKLHFDEAYKSATFAFCNESLSIQDRIFAAKFRVISVMLERLECPETAIISCMFVLRSLHGLPPVRNIFSVYLADGVRSMFHKAEREENVKSVMMINYVVYQFASKFSSKYSSKDKWPTIQLSDRSDFNPILSWEEISTRLKLDRVI